MNSSNTGLDETKRKLLELALRYRMLIEPAATRALGLDAACVQTHLHELAESQLVRSVLFLDGMRRYELSPFGCKVLGVHRCFSRPLGGQALPERYALLWYCTMEPANERVLFNPASRPSLFPNLKGTRLPQPFFYIDRENDRPVLAYLIVDHGGQRNNFVMRTGEKVARLRRIFADWVTKGLLRIDVLTTHTERQKRVERPLIAALGALYRKSVAVPDLGRLLP